MTAGEFSPYKYFTQIFNLWWVVFVAALLGGVLGYIFYQLHPPVYEATATYSVTIDLNRFPLQTTQEDLLQYNEDLAVNTTEGALLSPAVVTELLNQLQSKGMSLNIVDLDKNYTIERKHDIWELRYRNPVPQDAQTIVNTWAQIGYQAMLSWQASGEAPSYIIFRPPTLADLPTRPVIYGRNSVMLAGIIVGLAAGIVVSNRVSAAQLKKLSPAERTVDL